MRIPITNDYKPVNVGYLLRYSFADEDGVYQRSSSPALSIEELANDITFLKRRYSSYKEIAIDRTISLSNEERRYLNEELKEAQELKIWEKKMIKEKDLVQVIDPHSSNFGRIGKAIEKDRYGQWIVYSHQVNDHYPESSLRKVESYDAPIPQYK